MTARAHPAKRRGRAGRAAGSAIEWALHFPAERDPSRLAEILARDASGDAPPEDWADPAARAVVERILPAVRTLKREPFSRLYYGAEFCEHLIPSPERLSRVLAAARAAELPVTLLTPWATDRGLEKLRVLLSRFSLEAPGSEVVVNDWGVLRLVRREFPGMTPILGRLMNKMMRDPRAAPFYADGPGEARRAMAESSATLPIYRRFLRERGVRRIELDPLYQGIDLRLRGTGLRGTLHLPFGYVASGRICLSGSLNLDREDKFRFDLPCRHECQDYAVELQNTRSPYAESRDLILFQRGNTVFYSQEGPYLEQALGSLERIGIDRVVLELDVPM